MMTDTDTDLLLRRLRPVWMVFLAALISMPVHAGILDSLSSWGDRIGAGGSGKTFLQPDKAFVFTADVQDAQSIVTHWQIADGYHLYRNKFHFELLEAPDLQLGDVRFPKGKLVQDEAFGILESYYQDIDIPLVIQRSVGGDHAFILKVDYQGCADDGFCYPPISKTIDLVLPALTMPPLVAASVTSSVQAGDGDGAALPEQDRFANALMNNGLLANMGMMFVAGLLLAFTPCVFPMVPILSSIIVGQGHRAAPRRAFILTVFYVLAMSLTYTVAGVLAGLFGQSVQAVFQSPWILGTFSLLFVMLALSMFGLYEIQLPGPLQQRLNGLSQRQSTGTYIGAMIMGFLSALIVGPCVAAPMAGVLLYIGMQGNAWFGGLSLFVLSLGMGLPLLVFGASAGRFLPRAGAWMHVIRPVFGVMMLALAIWMLERIIPVALSMLLWACLSIGSAVFLGGLERLPEDCGGWRRAWKALGVILLAWGVMLIVGAGSGGSDIFRPLASWSSTVASTSSPVLKFKRFTGLSGLEQEIDEAKALGQPVMVDFYADWCVDCRRMEVNAFSNQGVIASLQGVRLLQADVTANSADDQALLQRFHLFGPPAILFFDGSGREVSGHRLVGYQSASELIAQLQSALVDKGRDKG